MTIKEYDAGLEPLKERFYECDEHEENKALNAMFEYQSRNMAIIAKAYKKKAKGDQIKELASEILSEIADGEGRGIAWMLGDRSSGYFCIPAQNIECQQEADNIATAIWKEIGSYLLDCDVCFDPWSKEWEIDVVAAGDYFPYWDGWYEIKKEKSIGRVEYVGFNLL